MKLYKGKRLKEFVKVQLTDFKTKISPAHDLTFWFYLQFPCGGWIEFDVRQIQEAQLQDKSDVERFRLIVDFEQNLIEEFTGKSGLEQLQLIADKISHLPFNYFSAINKKRHDGTANI